MTDPIANNSDDLLDSLLGDFLDESDELLAQLNDNLLQLDQWVRSLDHRHDQTCDADLLNEMFRAAHTLKGLSAMLGLTDINTLTHKIENVFDAARNQQLTVNVDVVDLVFLGVDQLTALVGLLKDPEAPPVDCDGVLTGIRQLLSSANAERPAASQARAESLIDEVLASEALASQAVAPSESTSPDPLDGVQDEDEIVERYLSIFIDETEAALDELSDTLLAFEGAGGPTELKQLLVISHKIKGSAASIGLNRAAKLAHLMEDLLQHLVETDGSLSREATDALLGCTDAFHHFVVQLRAGGPRIDRFADAARKLLASDSPSIQTYVGEVHFEPDLPAAGLKALLIREKLARLGNVCSCHPSTETLENIDRLDSFHFRVASSEPLERIIEQTRVAGVHNVTVQPAAEPSPTPPAASTPTQPTPAEASPAEQQASEDTTANDHQPDEPTTPQAQPVPPAHPTPSDGPNQSSKPPAAESLGRPTETVRVDIERLDDLMNLAGQLVINKAQFSRIGERLKATVSDRQLLPSLNHAFSELDKISATLGANADNRQFQGQFQQVHEQVRRIHADLEAVQREVQSLGHARSAVKDLLETIHQFDRVSNAVQQAVMDTRMVPIGPLFTRFNRVVRDIARENGKDIRLVIQGEKTELDKRMIDELSDPLIHLVRNSADHGIELPDVRERSGKPRQGTVTLDACHRGNSILIRITDDGRGLDSDRILRKCLDKGILTEADAEKMTARQIHQMIWVPGMSTAEKITGVSGRGMGMDIVKSKIEGLNGVVDIETVPGRGTTMTIKLPVTLAILPSLMVDIAGDVFAMPMEAVTEIVSVDDSCLSTVHGRQMAAVRGRVVSLVRLSDVLTFHDPTDAPSAPAPNRPPWSSSVSPARKSVWPSTASSARKTSSSSPSPRTTRTSRASPAPASSAMVASRSFSMSCP